MRILIGHNYYRSRAGECRVFETANDILTRGGHELALVTRDSAEIKQSFSEMVRMFLSSLSSPEAKEEIRRLIRDFKPDVAHFHNLFPFLSPAVFAVCRERGVPVVYTCHNFRIICPVGTFFNRDADCFRCTPGRAWPCLARNCRGSRIQSAAYAMRTALAWRRGAWKNVTLFVVPSLSVRDTYAVHGMSSSRMRVVPNPVGLPANPVEPSKGRYVAFAGRNTHEKGVPQLMQAARRLPDIPFQVAGAGYEEMIAHAPSNVDFVGSLSFAEMEDFWAGARLAVVPSMFLEIFGLSAAEPQAAGLPVVAFDSGALPEVVADGVSGMLSPRGDVASLASDIERLWRDPGLCRSMGRAGRERMAGWFSEDTHLHGLVNVYREAMTRANLQQGAH